MCVCVCVKGESLENKFVQTTFDLYLRINYYYISKTSLCDVCLIALTELFIHTTYLTATVSQYIWNCTHTIFHYIQSNKIFFFGICE